MKTLRICFLLVCLGMPAAAQPGQPELRPLSVEQCIMIALEHNLSIQVQRYEPRLARYTLAGSYGVYDPTFSMSAEHDYSLSPGGVDTEGRSFSGTETETDTLGSGLSGFLPWGMSYNLGGNFSDQTGNRPGLRTDPTTFIVRSNVVLDINGDPAGFLYTTNFGTVPVRSPFESASARVAAFSLSQPLLRDFWIDVARYTIYANKLTVRISDADFRDLVMRVITDVENAYYNLVFFEENVEVQRRALELAERLLAENRKRVEVGALAPLDEKQAESQVASSRADLLEALASRGTAQRILRNLLSDDYLGEWANVIIVPTDKLLAMPREFDLQESWRRGLERGPRFLLQQDRLRLEVSKQTVRLRKNQLFPRLDLVGSYGLQGSDDELSGALNQIGERESPFWSVGAQLSIPLSRISERNSYKAAKAAVEQATLALQRSEQNTLIRIEDDIGTARTAFERVDATRQATLYAQAALDAEQKKLESGKSTSFFVLQLQRDLTQARSAEIRALADYNISLAELAFDEGSTLERHRVDINWK